MPDTPAILSLRFPDLAAARKFYVEVLGFEVARDVDEQENMTVAMGAAQMMLEGDAENFYGEAYNEAIRGRSGQPGPNSVYIEAVDLDQLYQRCQDQSVKIVDPIGPRPWGQREFSVEDPAGNFLSFWSALE